MTDEKPKEPKPKKLVPGDPLPLVKVAEVLFGAMQNQDLELIGLDIRGNFRVGSEQFVGSVSGGGESDWKLYLSDSWEYRYLVDKELRTIKFKSCDRIMTMFRHKKSGEMYHGRILATGDSLEWKLVDMKPQP